MVHGAYGCREAMERGCGVCVIAGRLWKEDAGYMCVSVCSHRDAEKKE